MHSSPKPLPEKTLSYIKFIGVGTVGCRVIKHILAQGFVVDGIHHIDFIALHAKIASAKQSQAPYAFSYTEDLQTILSAPLNNSEVVIIVSGLEDLKTVQAVTSLIQLPQRQESLIFLIHVHCAWRPHSKKTNLPSQDTLQALRSNVDALIWMPTEQIQTYNARQTRPWQRAILNAYHQAVYGVINTQLSPGMLSVDWQHIQTLFSPPAGLALTLNVQVDDSPEKMIQAIKNRLTQWPTEILKEGRYLLSLTVSHTFPISTLTCLDDALEDILPAEAPLVIGMPVSERLTHQVWMHMTVVSHSSIAPQLNKRCSKKTLNHCN